MIPEYRLIERSDGIIQGYRIICEGDLDSCLNTLYGCEVSNIDSNDSYNREYTIERMKVSANKSPEIKLSDTEKRIFLAAMTREMKICNEVDNQIPDGIMLTDICRRIERKVKKVLF